jgi:D-galactose 1-dehydrogenase
MTIKLGIVGVGKIARDQHLPVIQASRDYQLVAAASRNARVDGAKHFTTLAAMLDGAPEIDAVSLCAPPIARTRDARLALGAGKHVFLEKPPGATLSEVHDLIDLASRNNVSLFASWHSRFAPAVAPARAWLAQREIRSAQITWKEDVRHWHPGQDWIFEPGGFGVFDPAINAFSIVTHILPRPFALTAAKLAFPENRQAPIAAELSFADANGAPIRASLDFLQTGPQSWDIIVETDGGRLLLAKGGAELSIDGEPVAAGDGDPHGEYRGLYAHFAGLVAAGQSDVDLAPLRHVADAFMLGERNAAPAFHF